MVGFKFKGLWALIEAFSEHCENSRRFGYSSNFHFSPEFEQRQCGLNWHGFIFRLSRIWVGLVSSGSRHSTVTTTHHTIWNNNVKCYYLDITGNKDKVCLCNCRCNGLSVVCGDLLSGAKCWSLQWWHNYKLGTTEIGEWREGRGANHQISLVLVVADTNVNHLNPARADSKVM